MTEQELLERSIQKMKDGADYRTISNFLNYQKADGPTIQLIISQLRQEEAKGNLVDEKKVEEERKSIFRDGIFSLIMGIVVLGFGLFMFLTGFIGVLIISMIVVGSMMILGGIIQMIVKK